jgi:hypothetical protein
MRNDARPMGENVHDESPVGRQAPDDARSSVPDDRSHIVNRKADENARRNDADVDPVMPTGDASLKTQV